MIRVSHAVEAPFYDSQNATSIADWPNRKKAIGAWGCAQGKWVTFCMPRDSFANVDPLKTLNAFDRIYVDYHYIRGSFIEDQRKQCFIADIDPKDGYMHSGYPIVTSMDIINPSNRYFYFN